LEKEYFFNYGKMGYVRGRKARGCILCMVRDRSPEVEDLTVFRDGLFLASVNLYPYNPGHLIVFPCRHVEDLRELTGEEEARLAWLQRTLLDVLDRTHSPRAYNIGYNMGQDAGASIHHLHLHIIPRYPRELGMADLIAGKRVLVQDPRETAGIVKEALEKAGRP
jgi:ATP adenylyltransferase